MIKTQIKSLEDACSTTEKKEKKFFYASGAMYKSQVTAQINNKGLCTRDRFFRISLLTFKKQLTGGFIRPLLSTIFIIPVTRLAKCVVC